MTGKERIFKVLSGGKADMVPWVPFAGVHAGKLCGYDATEVLKDADKLYESLMKVHQTYLPDGQPVIFDLQVEAEILGCDLMWALDSLPLSFLIRLPLISIYPIIKLLNMMAGSH